MRASLGQVQENIQLMAEDGARLVRITEILGDLAQGLGRGLGADEVDLDPRDAELGFKHVGHVVDGTVAHDRGQVGLVGRGELVVGRVAGEGGYVGDAALLEDAVDLE